MVRYGENNKCSQEINESGKRRKSVYRYMNRTLVAKKKEETEREREREREQQERELARETERRSWKGRVDAMEESGK